MFSQNTPKLKSGNKAVHMGDRIDECTEHARTHTQILPANSVEALFSVICDATDSTLYLNSYFTDLLD